MNASVLVLAFNEERNIGRCLASLEGLEDIVVVDSGSSDKTVEICRQFGARVLYRPFDNFAEQRNFGLEQGEFKYEWVLHLDADEVLPQEFRSALAALEPPPGIDGYQVPSKTILGGKWLRHAGMYPSYQARIGHRDRFRFIQVGHGQREDVPVERMGVFYHPYEHYSFSHGMVNWLEKHVRYARDEAVQLEMDRKAPESVFDSASTAGATESRRRLKKLTNRLPLALRPPLRFFYVYLVRRGFLDGFAGFRYAFMLTVYEGMIAVIAWSKCDNEQGNR